MKHLLLSLIFFLSFLILSGSTLAMSCTIRSGSCQADETCLFSTYDLTDSHAAECNYFDYAVCCTNLTSSTIKTSCSSDENGVLSLYSQTDSHVEIYGYENYDYHVCVKPYVYCVIRESCLSEETCVISLYENTNSHVAECGTTENNLCCKIVEGIGITIKLNTTKAWWNDSVLAQGVVINESGLPEIGADVIVKVNNVNNCFTTTNSSGGWNCSFNAPNEIGIYTVTAESSEYSASTSLFVMPNYGERAIGTANKVVLEIPMLIQDLNGKIKQVWTRIMVWRG